MSNKQSITARKASGAIADVWSDEEGDWEGFPADVERVGALKSSIDEKVVLADRFKKATGDRPRVTQLPLGSDRPTEAQQGVPLSGREKQGTTSTMGRGDSGGRVGSPSPKHFSSLPFLLDSWKTQLSSSSWGEASGPEVSSRIADGRVLPPGSSAAVSGGSPLLRTTGGK